MRNFYRGIAFNSQGISQPELISNLIVNPFPTLYFLTFLSKSIKNRLNLVSEPIS